MTNDANDNPTNHFPQIEGSVENFIENLTLIVEGIANTFGKNCEVVLHDLRQPEKSIIAIKNSHVSGRKVGGPIIGGPAEDKGLQIIYDRAEKESVVSNYMTRTANGRSLKSTTMLFRNDKGKPIVALCINMRLLKKPSLAFSTTAYKKRGFCKPHELLGLE